MLLRLIVCSALLIGYNVAWSLFFQSNQFERTNNAVRQMNNPKAAEENVMAQSGREYMYFGGWILVLGVIVMILFSDVKRAVSTLAILLVLCNTGCMRPIEPIILKKINSHEEAFLIPLLGDEAKQEAANNEEFYKKNLVFVKQVRIPQQWVPVGREWFGANGAWEAAAELVVVDIAAIHREWTADKDSGTGQKDEAIWVMTSDSIEFSTGWAVTAKIDDRDAAVKFLHNYRNGSLQEVMDKEIRGKVQTEFGLEVTDLPMETLRKSATPHLLKTIKTVKDFFIPKGINITNIGITGGFVYKNRSIADKMVAVFTAEQEKDIAVSKTKAQEEMNKAIILKATGEADAIMKTKKAEADGNKLIADSKSYEIEKAKENLPAYVQLKQLELMQRWDGHFPQYMLGSSPNLLLQVPK